MHFFKGKKQDFIDMGSVYEMMSSSKKWKVTKHLCIIRSHFRFKCVK